MNYIRQVQKGIDFIEANLDNELTATQVAEHTGISRWHFQRIFSALTNETLKTYIRSRRLAISLDKLLTTKTRIIDIALTAGYETQESFTRAFKKAFNLTPNEYRKLADKSLFLKKMQFDSEYLAHINSNISLIPEIYTQQKMQLIGLKTCFYSVDSEKNNIAEKLPPLWKSFLKEIDDIENIISGTGYGVVRQAQENSDLLEYYAAIEVSSVGYFPKEMQLVEIPLAEYAKFKHTGDVANINNTVNYIYSSWLMNSGFKHSYAADIEIYDSEYIPDSVESVMYYAIPIAE